ncbi:plastocyanin [Halogranum rubrum]|uniref:Plastocyanin n=1 Tax=Halogranum rubrum TaxID=553466 RepID=A0A1I4EEU1_9EURY|nr:plastocyanin/azurin family copper-binding protein [Halogranum rubrum]SFL03729.1 plastocyanin [Halogranum rubrum]
MTDGNAGLSRRAFLTAAGTAVAAAGTAAAQQEGNGTATGNQTTTASGGNATTTAAGNESAGNASAGGNTTAGNQSAGGNQSGGGNESGGGNQSGSGGSSGGMSKTVIVGPGNELVFDPAEVEVTPGSTITWVWESDNHNVVPESVPEGASWEGTGGDSEVFNTGHEYSHTFETEGTYEYYCAPHQSAGMVGSVSVSQDAGSSGGGGGGGPPTVPDSAKSLGVATTFSMIATLGLAYFFMKFGGDYGTEQQQ